MRFSYVRYDSYSAEKQEKFKKVFEELEEMALNLLPDSRPRSLFLTALEEAYMWTGKSIRDEQINRGVQPEHVPERTNE